MYGEKVLNLFAEAKHARMIRKATGTGEFEYEDTSERVRFYIMVENGKIVDVAYKIFGNVLMTALAENLSRHILNMTMEGAALEDFSNVINDIGKIIADKEYIINVVFSAFYEALSDAKKNIEKEKQN